MIFKKRHILNAVIISGMLFVIGCASTDKILPVKVNEHLEIGWTPREIFKAPPYASWFDTGYASYQVMDDYSAELKNMLGNLEIVIVYGTWCSDSQRELPRFFKVLDAVGFPKDKLLLIALDRTKQIPEGVSKEYSITHVPTFIIKYKGLEVGRLVEVPKTRFEQDLVEFLLPFRQ